MQEPLKYLMKAGFPLDFISRLHEKQGLSCDEIAEAVSQLIDHGSTTAAILEEYRAQYPDCFIDFPPPDTGQTPLSAFDFYSVEDLTEEERKPPEFIVAGLIPAGMTFVSGAPKIRKSFFVLQMAAAVATGQAFLGRDTVQCEVVYFDLEGSKSRIASRSSRMKTAIPRTVHITNAIPNKIADGALANDIKNLHRAHPTWRLFIVDTYSRARGTVRAGQANAYDVDVALLEPIQRMAIEENIAVVFVHHDKKGAGLVSDSFERLSGTMGISGSADSVVNLVAEGKRFDGKATMEYNPRDAKGGEMSLLFDDYCNEWQIYNEPVKDIKGNPVCAWILRNTPEHGKEGQFFTYKEAAGGIYPGVYHEAPSKVVVPAVEEYRNELFTSYGIGVQLGVKSHGNRGLRLIRLR